MQFHNRMFQFFLFFAYFTIFTGVLISLFITINPFSDEEIFRNLVNVLINKYNSLDSEQKNQIRDIFRDIFID
jgi:hypothetical protein